MRTALLILCSLLVTLAQAQVVKPDVKPAGKTPPLANKVVSKTPWGTPTLSDWNSVWFAYRGPEVKNVRENPSIPTEEYRPYYEAAQKARKERGMEIGQGSRCLPPGLPGVNYFGYGIDIIVNAKQVTILYAYMGYRRIRMNGEHPDYVEPSFMGDSVGHWEGDTLVIDTVGLSTNTILGMSTGIRHSNQLHVVERVREVKPGFIEFHTWMEDPRALVKPVEWISGLKKSDEDFTEFVLENCHENTKAISYNAFDYIPEPEQTEVHWAKPKAK